MDIPSYPYCYVTIVRHGQTDWNAEGRLQGQSDIPLNATGRSQAHELKELLSEARFDAAFSSDLSRAAETASIIVQNRNIPLILSPHLRELNAGFLEGAKIEEYRSHYRDILQQLSSADKQSFLSHKVAPDVESHAEIYQRVMGYLQCLALQYINKSLLIVSHGGVIRSILYHLSFNPGMHWSTKNCGWIQLVLKPQEITITQMSGVQLHKL